MALRLMSHLEEVTVEPPWTFGGGTVLMLRFDRFSKHIDLFVPDPQYLGYVNPRLGGPAEDLTSEYEENAQFIKLQLDAGEIDIVVGPAADRAELRGRRLPRANSPRRNARRGHC
ncbi:MULTISPECIES: nucleotidyl transferase AbiEii/AbiGii toxin family protein [Variovorax]|uniref:nucleotidyl transferase AbiEii/AbiGii toxin family protein n=1 Tax=Variovorax TaxID=34072 RepID=UPI002862FAA3|nr:nucleotidyl transferase AbiEii/AbiGii toxin family protein [Variovorax sp. 3319]MDR6890722.1 hypothetical protein [Variovorax sp. 3319]